MEGKTAQVARARVIFRGRVQGVFFRSFTQQTAAALDVSGFVKNLPDGSVEAVFEGAEPLVKETLNICRQGPPHASVEDMNIKWEPYSGEFRGFSVRY
ncbi:MAG: acylphosphatase [Nitrospiraceae bacterium]|nr:acylphosphatase [Nitrospiraceae bacterium]